MKHILLALLPLILAGCSTYSRRQCREMDWYREGRTAALEGYTPKQAKTHFIDKCQEDHGVAMDNVAFERGFSNGLNQLCTPEGLEALAAKGIAFQETCESHQDSVDLQKSRAIELEERIKELEAENARLKAEAAAAAAEE